MIPSDTNGWSKAEGEVRYRLNMIDGRLKGIEGQLGGLQLQFGNLEVKFKIKAGYWGLLAGTIPTGIVTILYLVFGR